MQITRTSLAIDTPTYRRFVDLARQNERSTSAELRVAIRGHLAGFPAADAADKLGGVASAEGGAATAVSSKPLHARGAGRAVADPRFGPRA
jgi:hypothetical protein